MRITWRGLELPTRVEWDKEVSPYLALIEMRAKNIQIDTGQIVELVSRLPAVPDFETTAIASLVEARRGLAIAEAFLQDAIAAYESKEKVT